MFKNPKTKHLISDLANEKLCYICLWYIYSTYFVATIKYDCVIITHMQETNLDIWIFWIFIKSKCKDYNYIDLSTSTHGTVLRFFAKFIYQKSKNISETFK